MPCTCIIVGLEEQQESTPIATPTWPSKDTPSAGKQHPRDQRMRELVLQALSSLFGDFEGLFEEQEGEEQEEAGKKIGRALKTTEGGQKPTSIPNSPSSAQTNSRTPHIPSSISSRFRTGDGVVSSDSPKSDNSDEAVGVTKTAANRGSDDIKDGDGQGNKVGDKGAHVADTAAHMEGERTSEDTQKNQEGVYVCCVWLCVCVLCAGQQSLLERVVLYLESLR